MADFTSSRAFRVPGAKAFAEAGITYDDVNHLMMYDAFAHLPVYGLALGGSVSRTPVLASAASQRRSSASMILVGLIDSSNEALSGGNVANSENC
jgi:hypothetical protein